MKGVVIRMIIISACLVMGLLLLWERNTLVRLGLEIQQFQRTQKTLVQAQHELLIEISSLSSYRRIEQIAINQMGMIRPDPQQVVKVINHRPMNPEHVETSIRVAERTVASGQ